MYENAKKDIDRILDLVREMPDALQSRGFEILLTGYVQSRQTAPAATETPPKPAAPAPHDTGIDSVPQELRTRLKTLAGQAGIAVDALLGLFDFAVDPFTLGSFVLDDTNSADKARKIALLVGVRNYIANGKWAADWNEIKAACVDHSCYDSGNFASAMSKGKGGIFKSVAVGASVELSASGQTDAKALITALATNAAK